MKFTEKAIKQLKEKGLVRGYTKPVKIKSQTTRKNSHRSKALTWLENELEVWANENYRFLLKEYQFDEKRKYRFDFAFKGPKIAIEFEGGIFLKKSGHNTATHYTKDANKYNLAVITGWRVLRFTALNYKTVRETLDKLVQNDDR